MSASPGGAATADPLKLQAEQRADAPALSAGSESWSYEALDRAARDVAAWLVEAGLKPGSVIGALMDATPAAIAAVHGVSRSGAILSPGHVRWTQGERSAFTRQLQPDAVLCEPGGSGPGDDRDARPIQLPSLDGAELILSRPADPPSPRFALPDGAHTLHWTSGSEGRPRLVCLGLHGQLHNARASARRVSLGPDDGWLASLSLAHVGGLGIVWRTAVAGTRLVLGPAGFDPEMVWEALRTGRVTHLSVVPVMLQKLLDLTGTGSPPEALRCVLVGGDATPAHLVEHALERGWPIATTYGLTEAASQVATAPPDLVRAKPGTVGPPLDGVRVRIGADGQILVAGPTVMLGYAGIKAAESPIREGWLDTGDLGRLDEEGHLWVTGRSADRIVSGGANVDPHEIEAILATHEKVLEVAVVGVPDDAWGERVAAVIATDALPAIPPEALESELNAWVKDRLSGPRRPRVWVFVRRIPRTATGKPDGATVRRLAILGVPPGGS
jgi:O-succinylbenzoic acid--CoA ligase